MNMRALSSEPVQQELWFCKSEIFTYLCKLLKQLSRDLYDPDEGERSNEAAILLRVEYARLRYLPWQGDREIFTHPLLSDKEKVSRIYGQEVVELLQQVEQLHMEWRSALSILINTFKEKFLHSISEYGIDNIRIACRASDKDLFLDVFKGEAELSDSNFITGLADYRQTQTFDVLYRIGSFRIDGIQRISPAIINSPKYRKLVRFCWDHNSDEIELAQDPVIPDLNYLSMMSSITHSISDNTCIPELQDGDFATLDDDIANNAPDYSSQGSSDVESILLTFSGNDAALFRKGHRQLVFRNSINCPEILLLTAREMKIDDFWIDTSVEVDLGKEDINFDNYPMARIWKSALHRFYRRQPGTCVAQMANSGIRLQDLYQAAESWSTFHKHRINAPQKKLFFVALIESVLPNNIWAGYILPNPRISIAENAWVELSHYKSLMIENGQLSHKIVADQLQNELRKYSALYRTILTSTKTSYKFKMPEDTGLVGSVVFRRIHNTERGFFAPEDMLSKLIHPDWAEQYRTRKVS
jgi:hypothetical protein